MGPAKRICRLCLQIVGEDVPYSPLTNNAKALRNLEHISSNTVKNLGLTEEPLICKLCDNKLEELSNFKETAIANESKIQSNQKADFQAFLKTLSEDVETICRVCLKSSVKKDELQKSWKDSEGLFARCNIQMDETIAVPTKICDGCHATLQNMTDFISLCSKNENFIEVLAAEKEKLTDNDLIAASLSKSSTKTKPENKNNKLRNTRNKINGSPQIKQPAKTKRNNSGVGKIKNKKQGASSNNNEEPKRSSTKQNSITEYMIKNCNDGDPQKETSCVTKTPKTYKSKKNTPNKLYSLELPSTSKAGPPTTDGIARDLILKQMNEQMEQMHISIDAIPVSDLSDITLSVNEEGLVQEQVTSECNVTQELIDVLEGRLNNRQPSDTSQGSSNSLKAELMDDVGIQDNCCYKEVIITVEPETKSKKGKVGKFVKNVPVDQVIDEVDIKKSTVRKTYAKTSTKHSNQHVNKRKANNIEISSVPKKTTSDSTEVLESPVSIKEENLPDAKQKTIIDSFNMKLLKKKENTSIQTPDQNMLSPPAENSENIIDGQMTSTRKVNRGTRKVNKLNGNSTDNGPPKKRLKRTVDEQVVTDATDTSQTKSPIEIISLPPNDAPLVPEENPDVSSEDDEFVEEELGNRSVTVTIIKGKKRTNKKQLDKTWQELTGVPTTHSTPSASNMVPGLEIAVVRKKRGRPPLPNHLKKEKPAKPPIIWLHCDQCPFKTYTQNSFIQHQLIHTVMSNIQTLQCDTCRFTTTNAELMQQHKATHESIHLIYKCVFCDEIFKKKISCMYHTLRHDDQDVASQFYCLVYNGVTEEEHFECYQCDHQSVEESTMPDHVIDHTIQKPKNPIVAKFKCDWCQYRTKSEDLLKRHKDLHASKSAKMNSRLDIKDETKPLIKSEPGTENDDEPPFLKCDQCHYMTRNKRSMSNHKGLKHNRKIHPVVQGKAAATKAVQEDKPMYYCNECSYSTHRKLNLPRHALVHRTKENMEFFECAHCLFETKHRRSYTRHMEAIHAVIV